MRDDRDDDDDEDDEVNDEIESEYPVYLSSTLAHGVTVLQCPSMARARALQLSKCAELRVKPNQNRSVGVFSTYMLALKNNASFLARFKVQLPTPADTPAQSPYKHELESTLVPLTTSHFVGRFDGNALHLTPVNAVVQLNPSFAFIDRINEQKLAVRFVVSSAVCAHAQTHARTHATAS